MRIIESLIASLILSVTIALSLYTFLPRAVFEQQGNTISNNVPTFPTASSTVFTISNTSTRLLGTSTPTRRVAALIQPVNCTLGGPIYLKAQSDAPATAGTGFAAFASSSLQLEDYPGTPVPQNAVQGIAGNGTCTVLVTEWVTRY